MEKPNASLSEVHQSVSVSKSTNPYRKLLSFIGPAYLVSVGYMDPGNWATDLAGGSQFGYKLIWVLLMSNLMALLLQTLSARLGIVKGLDLAQASRSYFPKFINIPLYILAEIAIAACDLAEVIGMAIGLNLLLGLPLIWGVCITILDSLLLLLLLNRGIRVLERFIVSLVFLIGLSFIIQLIIVKPEFIDIARGFNPTWLEGNSLYIAIGIIGATVMPHNLYLHSSLVQTRKVVRSFTGIKEALKFNLIDTSIALNLAFFVNAAILILAAAAFYKNGYTNVAEIQDAHLLLRNLFGSLAPALFAIALIASGQSSTVTGTLAGQIIMEGYLNLRLRPWVRRLLTRMIAIVPALFTVLIFGEGALGSLLVLSQVILSLQLGFAIIPLIHFVSNKQWMKEFVIPNYTKFFAWLITLIILSLNIKLVVDEFVDWKNNTLNINPFFLGLIIVLFMLIGALLIYIIFNPLFYKRDLLVEKNLPHGMAKQLEIQENIVFNTIGITIDFSKYDSLVISHALSQGGKAANYILIHIVETAGARFFGENIRDKETRLDEENIRKYVKELNSKGFNTNYKIGYGNPAKSIAELVEKSNIEILFMGAHGHKGIKDIIFGATVDSVRHLIHIPVFVVRN